MTTLPTADYLALKNSHKRGFRLKFTLFDPIPYTGPSEFLTGLDIANNGLPVVVVGGGRWQSLAPGESVTLSGADSYQRGGTPNNESSNETESLIEGDTLESVSVPVTAVDSVTSTTVLESGVYYRLRASGTAKYGTAGYAVFDPMYAQQASLAWGYNPALAVDSFAQVADDTTLDLVSHAYDYTIAGTGSTITLGAFDAAYGDNSGTWSVEIIELITVPGFAAATSPSYATASGDAIVSPNGSEVTVEPTGGEDSQVQIQLTVSGDNAETATGNVYIASSSRGWEVPTGRVHISGSYETGYTGSIETRAANLDGLAVDQILLIQAEMLYDGVKRTPGGKTLGVFRIMPWTYFEDHNGVLMASIPLESPASILQIIENYALLPELSNAPGTIRYADTSLSGTARYIADLRVSDAVLDLLTITGVNQYFNVYVWHDPYSFPNFVVPQMSIWDQCKGLMQSSFGVLFCNHLGDILAVPSPSIRADEWWDATAPKFLTTGDGPLTGAFLSNWQVHNKPEQKQRRSAIRHVTLTGYDSDAEPIKIYADSGDATGLAKEAYNGYLIPSVITGEGWAADYLAMLNRAWDVTVEMLFPGAALVVGDYVDVNIANKQVGQDDAVGRAYVNSLSHDIDMDQATWRSVFHLVEVTSG